jgi:pimeloyl-ACP methyl ester carboxylesterase
LNVRNVEFEILGGKIAGKRWGEEGGVRVIALHGWLDNANSFDLIAPALPELDLLVLDFAGHGYSDHRPRHTPYIGMLNIQEIIGVADQLKWESFCLMGHSMGAEVSTHIIGLYPDRVERLLAIDGFAASTSPAQALQDIRKSIDENLHRVSSQMRLFNSREEMAERVAESTGQTLESAQVLVERGAVDVAGGFSWRSDHRVRWSDALSLTDELLDHTVASFKGNILVVGASDGSDWYKPTIERLEGKFKHLIYITLNGSHHLHMDADTRPLVELIRDFFQLEADSLHSR